MGFYEIGNSALFAMDLLRRDRDGVAPRLVAYGLAVHGATALAARATNPSPLYADLDVHDRERVRERALSAFEGKTLDDMMDLLQSGEQDRNVLASLTAGTANDAWHAVSEFCGPESPVGEQLADAVLWTWARPWLGTQDCLMLSCPALPYLAQTRANLTVDELMGNLGGWREFDPHVEAMRALLGRVSALTGEDFDRIDQGPDTDERWEHAMEAATQAASDRFNEQQVAIAQLVSVGVLGARARLAAVELATLVVTGISLVAAVQATMLAEVLDPAVTALLTRDFPIPTH